MDAEYLKSTLGDLLSEGLAATVLKNPRDKVEFLAHWLQASVAEKQRAAAAAAQVQQAKEQDKQEEIKEEEQEQKAAAAEVSQAATKEEREKQFLALIANATTAEGLLPAFLQMLRDETGATSAYLGELEVDKETAESRLKYLAATPENDWLLDKRLDGRKGRNTFELFREETEEEPEQEDEDGKPIPRAPKPLRSVFVPNVLLGPKSANMFFFKQPALGSYTAVRLAFPQCVSDAVLDEALEREPEILQLKQEMDEAKAQAEKEAREEAAREAGEDLEEDEEEGEDDEDEDDSDDDASSRRRRKKKSSEESEEDGPEESEDDREARLKREDDARLVEEEEFLLTQVARPPVEFALCLDTLGQNRRFSSEQLATILRFGTLLQAKLQALDRASFTVQRRLRAALIEFNREVSELNDAGTLKTDDEKAEELERCSDELEALGKPMTEEDVVFKYRTELILSHLKAQIAEWPQSDVLRGDARVLQAVMFLLGYPQRSVVDAEERADWRRMRQLLSGEAAETFFAKLRDYDPRATHFDAVRASAPAMLYTESVAVTKVLDAAGEHEDCKLRNYALSELMLWAREALAVKRRAKLERAREAKRAKDAADKAAEEARIAEEEAAERAERLANGEEEPEEEEDEDQESD